MQQLNSYLVNISEEKAALFIGAGISKIAGCMSLDELSSEIKSLEIIKQNLVRKNINPRELIAYCKSLLRTDEDRHKFDGVMRNGLYPDPEKYSKDYIPFIKIIRKIDPLPPILTTNIDTCLTATKLFEMSKIYHKANDIKIDYFNGGSIFHLHGSIEESGNQVWDIDDYPKRYNDNNFKNFIKTVFREYSVLFLGYSFGDKEILDILRETKTGSVQKHYVLLPEDDYPDHVDRNVYRELYNIEVITYNLRSIFVSIFSEWVNASFDKAKLGSDPSKG